MTETGKKSLKARLAKNLSWTFAAQIIAAVLGLVALFFTARALGPAGLGIIALVEAYVRIVDRLLRLEPYQAAVKFGVAALERGDKAAFLRLIKLSLFVDLAGGILAGTVALLLASLVAPWIGLPADEGPRYIAIVAASLFISFRPTGTFILRSIDRFDVLSKVDVLIAVARVLLTALAFAFGFDLVAFLWILFVQGLLNGTLTLAAAWREINRRSFGNPLKADALAAVRENQGFLRFLWNSNINVMMRQSTNRFDVLILGALVDAVSVGYYEIGKRAMIASMKAAAPLRQAIYPEMVRLWSNDERRLFVRLTAGVSFLLLSLFIAMTTPIVIHMDSILEFVFGPSFVPASQVVTILLISAVIFLSGVALNPALLAMGHDRALIRVTFFSLIIFVTIFAPMVYLFGAEGAAMSNLLFNASWTVLCLISFRKALKA